MLFYALTLGLLLLILVFYGHYTIYSRQFLLYPIILGIFGSGILYFSEEALIPFTLFQLFLITGFIYWLLHNILNSKFYVARSNFEIEAIVILLVITFSLIYSTNKEEGLFVFLRILILFIYTIIIIDSITSFKFYYKLFNLVLVVAVILAGYSVYQIVADQQAIIGNLMSESNKLTNRSFGTANDPNVFGSLFILPISISTVYLLNAKTYLSKIIYLIIFTFLIGGIIPTYSRSTWVSIMIMVSFISLIKRDFRIFYLIGSVSIFTIIAFPDLRYFLTSVAERFIGIFTSEDLSSNIRIYLGIGGIELFLDNLFFGTGFRSFPIEITNYIDIQKVKGVIESHNVVLSLLTEFGLIGFTILSYCIFNILLYIYRSISLSHHHIINSIPLIIISAILGYIVFFQFYVGYYTNNMVYTLIGLGLAFPALFRNRYD